MQNLITRHNCSVGKVYDANGKQYIAIENRYCTGQPCMPKSILGAAFEGCENCKRTF